MKILKSRPTILTSFPCIFFLAVLTSIAGAATGMHDRELIRIPQKKRISISVAKHFLTTRVS